MIPTITIFVRHAEDCPHLGDEFYKRCNCRKHLRWTWEGKQYRRKAGSRSWSQAESVKRNIEMEYETAQSKKPIDNAKPATVSDAVEAFINAKTGAQKTKATIAKYKLTLKRLEDYCNRQGITLVRSITLDHLNDWRAAWDKVYSTNFGMRNEQSRVRAFFNYCEASGKIDSNPARNMEAIKIREDDYVVDPFTEDQVNKIIAAVTRCSTLTVENKARVQALMRVQRWSGLSLIDAVGLQRDELVKTGDRYRIDTSRRKTGTKVQVPVPSWLGEELLNIKNGNEQYFFGSGRPRATSYFDKAYRKVFKKAAVKNGGSHRFRHRFAVSLLESGVDIRVVSKLLGHRSLATTERFYGKWNQKQQDNLEAAVSAAWAAGQA